MRYLDSLLSEDCCCYLTYLAITFLRTILVMVLQLVIGGKQ
jgi:hypothetical protein